MHFCYNRIPGFNNNLPFSQQNWIFCFQKMKESSISFCTLIFLTVNSFVRNVFHNANFAVSPWWSCCSRIAAILQKWEGYKRPIKTIRNCSWRTMAQINGLTTFGSQCVLQIIFLFSCLVCLLVVLGMNCFLLKTSGHDCGGSWPFHIFSLPAFVPWW